jgi:transposase-like protein
VASTVGQRDAGRGDTALNKPPDHELGTIERLAKRLERAAPIACPYCTGTRLHRWGKSKRGRPRHSCRGCRRTFSAATGTIVLNIHDQGKLHALLARMVGGATLSCRCLAAELGLNKNTIWRWRSAIMAALETLDVPAPEPAAEADLHIVRESRKASREWVRHAADPLGFSAPDRPRWIDVDSGRHPEPLPRAAYRVPLLVVLDSGQGWRSERYNGQAAGASSQVATGCIDRLISDALGGQDDECRERQSTTVISRRSATGEGSGNLPGLGSPGERLQTFLRPFRGPATRHLSGYLAWFTATRPAAVTERVEQAWAALLSLRPTQFWDMHAAAA